MASGVQGEPGGRSPDEEGSCERSLNEVCWENIVISRVFFCFYLSRRKVRHVCVRTVEVFMAGVRGAGNLRVTKLPDFLNWKDSTETTLPHCSIAFCVCHTRGLVVRYCVRQNSPTRQSVRTNDQAKFKSHFCSVSHAIFIQRLYRHFLVKITESSLSKN